MRSAARSSSTLAATGLVQGRYHSFPADNDLRALCSESLLRPALLTVRRGAAKGRFGVGCPAKSSASDEKCRTMWCCSLGPTYSCRAWWSALTALALEVGDAMAVVARDAMAICPIERRPSAAMPTRQGGQGFWRRCRRRCLR